ncbi:MAG: hypothetical protein IPJ23_13755 [Ignavibacteriales bacterium]|nr:hypothetical protein [Ignavibacteriales bacterium]
MLETMKPSTSGKKLGYFNYLIAFTFLLMFLSQGCSKEENPAGGGTSTDCQLVAKSPGTWDITLNFPNGDPYEFTGMSIVQTSCTVTMSKTEQGQTITVTGPLSNTGVWTASLSLTGGYTANFSCNFGGGPPYTTITNISGTDSEGDTISGGSGAITP